MAEETPQESGQAARLDPASIDALQEERLRVAQMATREQYARQCLAVFAPEPRDGARSYAEILARLHTVIAQELEEVERHARASDR